LGYPESTSLSLSFVDTVEIKELNVKYFKRDKTTNVIAFPMHYKPPPPLKIYMLGDVVICPDVAKKEAKLAGITFYDRLIQLLIHGILHLHGYRDGTKKEWREMQKKQDELFNAVKKI